MRDIRLHGMSPTTTTPVSAKGSGKERVGQAPLVVEGPQERAGQEDRQGLGARDGPQKRGERAREADQGEAPFDAL